MSEAEGIQELNLNFGDGGDKPIQAREMGEFPLIDEGTYEARVENIDVKDTKEKDGVVQKTSDGQQARYLNVKYKIMGGDFDGQFVWGINSIRFPENPLDDNKKERQTREFFLGWLNKITGTGWEDTQQNLNLKNLVGSEVKIVVTHQTYEGKPRASVNRVLGIDDPSPESSSGKDLDSLRKTI